MDQNNEKPVKESVFLAEVIVIMVVNLLKAIIVVSMLLHNGCYFKNISFSEEKICLLPGFNQ